MVVHYIPDDDDKNYLGCCQHARPVGEFGYITPELDRVTCELCLLAEELVQEAENCEPRHYIMKLCGRGLYVERGDPYLFGIPWP